MKITIIAVGKIKESFWKEALFEYLKRIGPYADVSIVEVADVSADKFGEKRSLELEAADITARIPGDAYLVALDIAGKNMSSAELSKHLDSLALYESRPLVFLIGGSSGLEASLLSRADLRLSFGRITLPHNLARVVLVEQLYRAFKISRGEPYHK